MVVIQADRPIPRLRVRVTLESSGKWQSGVILWQHSHMSSGCFPPVLNVISGFETVTECLVFKDNWTALISASKEGHLHVVEELLKCGGSLEHRDMVRRCSRPRRDCDGDRPRGAGAR